MAVAGELDSRADVNQAGGESQFWQMQLDLSERDHTDFEKAGREVIERYKSESKISSSRSDRKKFNILFSNTEVEKAALFARMAKPDVRRRFSDPDPTGRQIAELVERTLIATNDTGDAQREVMAAVEDYVLPGRGIVRVRYEAQTSMHPETGQEYVSQQDVWDEHILWRNFRHEPAETWSQVTWIAFKQLMTKDDLHANFDDSLGAEMVEKIPLNFQPDTQEKKRLQDAFRKAEVWEVWDKVMRQRLWVVKGYDKILRKDADPYGLEDFYPMPEPLQAVTTNDSFIPQPEFMIYKDQADGLDEIEARIDRLTKALKRRGVYNAQIDELKRVGKAADNEFIPVRKWDELKQGGGLKNSYEVEDLTQIVAVLAELSQQRELRKQTIYEVIGIADIMRGVSNPNETLGAQQLKAKFGSDRLKKRQDRVQTFIRDLLRLKAEIIAEHYEPQKLAEMSGFQWIPTAVQDPATGKSVIPAPPAMPQLDPTTGQPMPTQPQPPQPVPDNSITPQMLQTLRTDRLRSYRIDIETDSTIYEDAEAEKQSRVELLQSMTQFVGAWVPVIQGEPKLLPLAMSMLEFGVRGFKAGRELEEQIDQAQMSLEQGMTQPPQSQQPPPPSPAEQAQAAKMQQDMQIGAQKTQQDMALAQQKNQREAEMHQATLAEKAQRLQLDQADQAHRHLLAQNDQKAKLAAQNKQIVDEHAAEMGQPVETGPSPLEAIMHALTLIAQSQQAGSAAQAQAAQMDAAAMQKLTQLTTEMAVAIEKLSLPVTIDVQREGGRVSKLVRRPVLQ